MDHQSVLNHLREEYHDMKSYKEMEKEALSDHDHEAAFFLAMVARDEKSHAEFLEHYAEKHGMAIPADIMALKKEMEEWDG